MHQGTLRERIFAIPCTCKARAVCRAPGRRTCMSVLTSLLLRQRLCSSLETWDARRRNRYDRNADHNVVCCGLGRYCFAVTAAHDAWYFRDFQAGLQTRYRWCHQLTTSSMSSQSPSRRMMSKMQRLVPFLWLNANTSKMQIVRIN